MSNCGCKGPCRCGSTKIVSSSCCGNTTPQCCSPALPCAPTPYFSQSPTCQEDNVQNIIYETFRAELTVANSWNIPDCGGSAVLSVNGLRGLLIGSYLWNVAYGYFQVIGFNAATNQITVQNNCDDGNAETGTQVPACSEFIITDPPGDSGGTTPSLFPFVAIDFTAPAVSTCIDITVTTVNGLAVGKDVQIGSGTYRLASIPSSSIINICNDGAGIVPGTSVIAKNAQGQYQYPVVLIDTNPCTNTSQASGALLVCAGGVAVPLDGTTAGSIPVLVDPDTNEVQFQVLDVPTRTCSALTACLTLTTGQQEYTLTIGDTSGFAVGDIIQIGTFADRYIITDIPDSTHLIVLKTTIPASIVTIQPGVSVCIVDCCEVITGNVIPCNPTSIIDDIPLRLIIEPVELDADGAFIVDLTEETALYTATRSEDPPICDEGIFYAFKSNTSVAVVTEYVSIDGAGAIYQEVETYWNPDTVPAGRTAGKMVWFDNFSSDSKGAGGWPADAFATFNQLTTVNGDMDYHQNDIAALTFLQPGDTQALLATYRGVVGDNFPPSNFESVSFMISGWVERVVTR